MSGIREGLLVGCGNPLLDIAATVDDDLLKKYDMLPDNAILAEDKHKPLYNELIEKYDAHYVAGGSVQNSLRVAQWLLRKPNVTVFFGGVGDDKFAEILKSRAMEDGVNVRYQYTEGVGTGTCAVLITGTHRSLCAYLGAANTFKIDHLKKPENARYIEEADFIYTSGFFITVSPDSIAHLANHSFNNDKVFLMNLSAPFVPQLYKQILLELLPFTDVLIGNELECAAFAKEMNYGTECMKEIALKMASHEKKNSSRKRMAVITQGAHPVIIAKDGVVTEYPVEPLNEKDIVDTNGAGDAFVGGFLSQFIQGQSVEVCVKCGIWAAQEIIKRSSCTFDGEPSFKP